MTCAIFQANKHNSRNLQVLLSYVASPGVGVFVQPALQLNCPVNGSYPTADILGLYECVLDLLSESPQFKDRNKPQEIPVISQTAPSTSLSDLLESSLLLSLSYRNIYIFLPYKMYSNAQFLRAHSVHILFYLYIFFLFRPTCIIMSIAQFN